MGRVQSQRDRNDRQRRRTVRELTGCGRMKERERERERERNMEEEGEKA